MAKALVGYRVAYDQRLMLETLELRRRVRDLEHLVDRLQRDNDELREDLRQTRTSSARARLRLPGEPARTDSPTSAPAQGRSAARVERRSTPDELLRLRASIDNIDAALIHLLAERFKCTQRWASSRPREGCRPPTPRARSARSRGCGPRRRGRAGPGVRREVPRLRHRRGHPPPRADRRGRQPPA